MKNSHTFWSSEEGPLAGRLQAGITSEHPITETDVRITLPSDARC
jgi:hypothetical protein